MKLSAFKYVAAPTLAAAHNADDQLVAYDFLREIAKHMGLKRETRRLTRILRALRDAEREQLKFAALLAPFDIRRPKREGHDGTDGKDGKDGHAQ